MQVRAELVDGRLGAAFSRWYPGFTEENQLYRIAPRPHHLNHSPLEEHIPWFDTQDDLPRE